MKARIYQRLDAAILDLGNSDAFAPGEKTLLEVVSRLHTRELLDLRCQVLRAFPDAQIEREHGFRSDPIYLSWLITCSQEYNQAGTSL